MDKLNNSQDTKRFLQGLGIQIDETVVHQVVDTLSGKSQESFYSIYATRPNKLPPICGKGTAYKIKKLYDEGELNPYLAYLAAPPTNNRENETIEENLISPPTEKPSEKSMVEQPKSTQVEEAETNTLESQRKEASWNMATLKTQPLPAEAIPVVLKVKDRGWHLGKFTVRQVLWITRLYRVISDIALLDDISWRYALLEKICQLSGTAFDTTKYDALLKSPKQLIKLFESESPKTKSDFETRKAAFEAITTYTLSEPSYEIYFKGNAAWAKRKFQPDVLLGSRDNYIEELKKLKHWKKTALIPEGDFSIRTSVPIIFEKKLEERSNSRGYNET